MHISFFFTVSTNLHILNSSFSSTIVTPCLCGKSSRRRTTSWRPRRTTFTLATNSRSSCPSPRATTRCLTNTPSLSWTIRLGPFISGMLKFCILLSTRCKSLNCHVYSIVKMYEHEKGILLWFLNLSLYGNIGYCL